MSPFLHTRVEALASPVDNRDNARPRGASGPVAASTVVRWRPIRANLSRQRITHAFSAAIPRRAARPASGLGRRRPAREAQEGGTRVEGALALQQGAHALVHGQRPEGFLSRLLVRQAR